MKNKTKATYGANVYPLETHVDTDGAPQIHFASYEESCSTDDDCGKEK